MNKQSIILMLLISISFLPPALCIPLFDALPQLREKIAHIELGDYPTPVTAWSILSEKFNCQIYCKRDDLAGPLQENGRRLFGGNKVRKLEFVLADALACDAHSIVTYGCAGSNHALATAIYGQRMGFDVTCILSPQPPSWVVQRNLLLQLLYGATLQYQPSYSARVQAGHEYVAWVKKRSGRLPYVIPPGASMPVGVIGFINAVYELQQQVSECQMPVPDYIYVPAGSLGTTVGLLMGLQLTHSHTQVIAISVEVQEDIIADVKKLFDSTREYLVAIDSCFDVITWNQNQLIIKQEYVGSGYGYASEDTLHAVAHCNQAEGLLLEDTYTAKAAAALLADGASELLTDKVVLFWMTFHNDISNELVRDLLYTDLPSGFHQYFQKSSKT